MWWLVVSFFGGMVSLWLLLWGVAIWEDYGVRRRWFEERHKRRD